MTSEKIGITHANRSALRKAHFDKNARASLAFIVYICILRLTLSLVIVVIEKHKEELFYSSKTSSFGG